MKRRLFFASFAAVCAACFLCYRYFDIPVAHACRALHPAIHAMFQPITRLGLSTPYLIVAVCAMLYFRYVKKDNLNAGRALLVFAAIAGSGLAVDLVKFILGRYRPNMLFDEGLYGFAFFETKHSLTSFPSGHAATITAFALALYLMYPRWWFLYAVSAVLVAGSRVIIGSHFPSDVILGAYIAVVGTLAIAGYLDRRGVAFRLPASATWAETTQSGLQSIDDRESTE